MLGGEGPRGGCSSVLAVGNIGIPLVGIIRCKWSGDCDGCGAATGDNGIGTDKGAVAPIEGDIKAVAIRVAYSDFKIGGSGNIDSIIIR